LETTGIESYWMVIWVIENAEEESFQFGLLIESMRRDKPTNATAGDPHFTLGTNRILSCLTHYHPHTRHFLSSLISAYKRISKRVKLEN
jgi:hypothetical protein